MQNHTCSCCGDILLNYTRNRQTYSFCRRCWQEMPNIYSGLGVSLKVDKRNTSIIDGFR